MSNECSCINPDGGGTKCPEQHIAICIRKKDGHCYGECVPIPDKYKVKNEIFVGWLRSRIEEFLFDDVIKEYPDGSKIFGLMEDTFSLSSHGGRANFRLGSAIFYVKFSFEFKN